MTRVPELDTISVVLYDSSRQRDWNTYVDHSQQTVFAHHIGWKSVVEETFGHEAFYLMAYRNGRVAGVLPLFLVKSIIFGRFLLTSPFLTFGGIASDDEATAAALVHRAVQTAREQRVHYLEIRNQRQYHCLPYTKSTYCTLVLDLSAGEQDVWGSRLTSTTRRNVRRARKAGLEIVEGHDYLDIYVNINAQNMRRLGTPAHSRTFFHNIVKHFPQSTLLMARSNQTYVGGMLLVQFKDTILMPWVASLQDYLHMRPNNLLYWEAVVRACGDGYRLFDFGRSKWNSGTFRFKMQYGAEPVQLYFQFYLNRANKVPDVDPDSRAFKHLVKIWRKIPIPALNLLGPRIIRNIP